MVGSRRQTRIQDALQKSIRITEGKRYVSLRMV